MPIVPTWRDWIRSTLLIVFAVGQLLAGFLPDLLGWDVSIASRSAEYNTVLIPAGWAFLIWLPLFLGNIAFAFYHALPKVSTDPLMRAVGWLAVLAFAANTFRSIYEPLNGPDWISFVLLEAILVPLLFATILIVRTTRALKYPRWVFAALIGQAGWITVASAAGFSQVAVFEGWELMGIQDFRISAFLILAVWILPVLCLVWLTRSFLYTGAIAWGLFWIFFINQARGELVLAWSALGIAGLILFVCLAAQGRHQARPIQTPTGSG